MGIFTGVLADVKNTALQGARALNTGYRPTEGDVVQDVVRWNEAYARGWNSALTPSPIEPVPFVPPAPAKAPANLGLVAAGVGAALLAFALAMRRP